MLLYGEAHYRAGQSTSIFGCFAADIYLFMQQVPHKTRILVHSPRNAGEAPINLTLTGAALIQAA
jgi:hypothetical protein